MNARAPMLQQANLLSGRQLIMLAIIAMHGLIISALMAMRVMPDAEQPPDPIIGRIDPPQEVLPPPPPEIPVTMAQPQVTTLQLPVPDVTIPVDETAVPLVAPAQAAPVETAPPQAPTGTGNAIVPRTRATALQYRAVRSADDYYPAASLSLQEAGTAIVQVCVAPSGKLEGAPVIQQSSGSSRLDGAALKWAREALRFTPATLDGVPVSACKGFRVNFRLH